MAENQPIAATEADLDEASDLDEAFDKAEAIFERFMDEISDETDPAQIIHAVFWHCVIALTHWGCTPAELAHDAVTASMDHVACGGGGDEDEIDGDFEVQGHA